MDELETMYRQDCRLPVSGGCENTHGKVNILLQAHVSRSRLDSFSLISDSAYVVQVRKTNSIRKVMHGIFEKLIIFFCRMLVELCDHCSKCHCVKIIRFKRRRF